MALLHIHNLSKRYPLPSGGSSMPVFSDVHMDMEAGEFVALLGESGVGKSTLLNCIAGLDTVSGGRIELAGTDIHALPEAAQAHFRPFMCCPTSPWHKTWPCPCCCSSVPTANA